MASYFRMSPTVAEAAFAVDDRLQGKGIATLLLERLAAFASANGFTRFQATTMAENTAMIDVFRDSGFEIRSQHRRRHGGAAVVAAGFRSRRRGR